VKWVALLPLKPAPLRKMRLAGELGPDERLTLTAALLDHVAAVLETVPAIARITLLTIAPPSGWRHGQVRDRGRTLNREIEAARARLPRGMGLLVLHPDLPLLGRADVANLLSVGQRRGIAVAADRHRTGSNALALLPGRAFRFRFGHGSLALHRRQGARIVVRPGLMLDIDRADDMLAWRRQISGPVRAGRQCRSVRRR
jgi:2-phospho-L-lactate/phosphoenolpyruvate guanylyltransferase